MQKDFIRQTCIATKTFFETFGFFVEAKNNTPNLTACCMNVPNLVLLQKWPVVFVGCSSFPKVKIL